MKIYFRNKAARLKNRIEGHSCSRCPFGNMKIYCPWGKSTIIDCQYHGWWIDGESLDIFKL